MFWSLWGPQEGELTLSKAVHGANNGPGVNSSQGAWLVGGHSLENLMLAASLVGEGSRGVRGQLGTSVPHPEAGQGSRSGDSCPSNWPSHGQGQGQDF